MTRFHISWRARVGRHFAYGTGLRGVLLTLLVALLVATNAQARTDRAATPQVQAQLIASVEAVQPGAEIYLGLHQHIIPHWHTYWINPGDSGSATSIACSLSSSTPSGFPK